MLNDHWIISIQLLWKKIYETQASSLPGPKLRYLDWVSLQNIVVLDSLYKLPWGEDNMKGFQIKIHLLVYSHLVVLQLKLCLHTVKGEKIST